MKCEEMRTARVEQREEMINFSGTDRAIACFLLGFCYKGVNACKIGETFIICSCIALGLLFFFSVRVQIMVAVRDFIFIF